MLSLWKFSFDRIGLGYDFSSPSVAFTSTIVFVPPTNNVETKNNDGKNELARKNWPLPFLEKQSSILPSFPN